MPEGPYVTVQYRSKYSNTNSAQEIVRLIQSNEREWKIVSYLADYKLNDNKSKD